MTKPQNYDNHMKLVPGFHYIATPLLIASLAWASFRVFEAPSFDTIFAMVLVAYIAFNHAYTRLFALGVQDRVIRLEERLRLETVLDDELRSRIPELTTSQLIGLRFAADDEVADLVRRTLDGEFESRKAIKQAVRNWRADWERV
jgi:hypothetical protein